MGTINQSCISSLINHDECSDENYRIVQVKEMIDNLRELPTRSRTGCEYEKICCHMQLVKHMSAAQVQSCCIKSVKVGVGRVPLHHKNFIFESAARVCFRLSAALI